MKAKKRTLDTFEKTYSDNPAARRKREYRQTSAVREAERLRQNASYAAKKALRHIKKSWLKKEQPVSRI